MTHAEIKSLLSSYGAEVIKTTNRFGKVVTSISWQDYMKVRDIELPSIVKLKLV